LWQKLATAAQLHRYTAQAVGRTQPKDYLLVSNPIYFGGMIEWFSGSLVLVVVVSGTLIKGAASSLVVKPAPDVK